MKYDISFVETADYEIVGNVSHSDNIIKEVEVILFFNSKTRKQFKQIIHSQLCDKPNEDK